MNPTPPFESKTLDTLKKPVGTNFDPAYALEVLEGIKGGSATFFREPGSDLLAYVERLRVCRAVTLFEGNGSVIATLTPSGDALRTFLACWHSTSPAPAAR